LADARSPGDFDRLTAGRKIQRFIRAGKKIEQRDFDLVDRLGRWIDITPRRAD
jgi:hypothetical protein